MERIEKIMAEAKKMPKTQVKMPTLNEKMITANTKVSDSYMSIAKKRLCLYGEYLNVSPSNAEAIDALLDLSGLIRAACDGLAQAQTILPSDKAESFADYVIFGDGSKYFSSKPLKKPLNDEVLALTALYMLKSIHQHWCMNHVGYFVGREYEFMPMILTGIEKLSEYFDIVSLCLDLLGFQFDANIVVDLYANMQKEYLYLKSVKNKKALVRLVKGFTSERSDTNLFDDSIEHTIVLMLAKKPSLAKEIVRQFLGVNPQMLRK